jgi:hypothetical protein
VTFCNKSFFEIVKVSCARAEIDTNPSTIIKLIFFIVSFILINDTNVRS